MSLKVKVNLTGFVIICFVIIGVIVYLSFFTASAKIGWKHKKSSLFGLHRTIEVYSDDGDLVKTYKGKCKIEEEHPYKTKFIMDGKKSISISGGLIIIEEE